MIILPSYELHQALAVITRKRGLHYHVSPIAPENLDDLNATATSRLVVYSDFSDQTIFGAASDNHCQRAWHDYIHLELQADTSVAGEYRVARQQCLELERVAGSQLADWLWCDLYGQTRHYGQFGCFPTDQAAFVHHLLTTGQLAQF